MSDYVIVGGELCHYGVKGMKWGVRKKRYNDPVAEKKAAYKQARKDYSKSFNNAYNKSIAAYSPIKKHRQANDERWTDASNKADRMIEAKSEYKRAKREQKAAIKSKTQELNKNASAGEKLIYNDATRRTAAAYMVKHNMSMEEATKKAQGEARRNTAAILAVYGAVSMVTLYKMNH